MKQLKEKIRKEGRVVGTEILKVDGFLNHRLDVAFLEELGKEFGRRFADAGVNKLLTVEASGIAVACMAAPYFNYSPVVFAKKATPSTMTEEFYGAEAKSFTKGTVSIIRVAKKYLEKNDRVLILDDFLAHGEAAMAMAGLIEQAGAQVAGIGAVIEKGFQGGGKKLKDAGYRLESLAIIEKMEDGVITFL